MKTKEEMAEEHVTRYNYKDPWIKYEMRKCGRLSFIQGYDACLKSLSEAGDEFDSVTARWYAKQFNDGESFFQGARWQHSQDQLKIQLIKDLRKYEQEKIQELEAELEKLKVGSNEQ